MASTQFKMRYGQYSSEVAKQLSLDYLGTVVYSGLTREIWVDGKCIAANYQGTVEDLTEMIGSLSNLKTTDKSSLVNAINTLVDKINDMGDSDFEIAEVSNDGEGDSSLTIFGVKQTEGKVEHDATKDVTLKIEGEYADDNPLVTKLYVDERIDTILGGEDLDKTLDTIKEIQEELLKDVKYFVTYTEDSEPTVIEVTKVVDEETGAVTYVDENDNVVASEDGDAIVYEEGYSNLETESTIDTLLEANEKVNNLNNKGLVANIAVSENKNKSFVTKSEEIVTDEFGATTKSVTIDVDYGTFKTGHGDVFDKESTAFVDGVATVKDVQNYVEERFCWDEFVSNANTVVDAINNSSEETYNVPNSVELDENIVIGQ